MFYQACLTVPSGAENNNDRVRVNKLACYLVTQVIIYTSYN